jgi:hypothetical protein
MIPLEDGHSHDDLATGSASEPKASTYHLTLHDILQDPRRSQRLSGSPDPRSLDTGRLYNNYRLQLLHVSRLLNPRQFMRSIPLCASVHGLRNRLHGV